MTRPPVQLMSAIPPWRGMRSFSQQPIEVGGTATVFSIPWFFLYAPLANKIAKGTDVYKRQPRFRPNSIVMGKNPTTTFASA